MLQCSIVKWRNFNRIPGAAEPVFKCFPNKQSLFSLTTSDVTHCGKLHWLHGRQFIQALLSYCCCCCLPQSFHKSNGLVSKDLQKYHFCSSLLVAPVSRHQLVCKSSLVQYIWQMGTGLRSPDLTCQPIKLAPGLQGNSKPLEPKGHSWPCDLFKTRYAPQVWIHSFEICYLDLPKGSLNWDLCAWPYAYILVFTSCRTRLWRKLQKLRKRSP